MAAVQPDPDELRRIAPMTAAPQGVQALFLLMETYVLTRTSEPGDSNVPGHPCPLDAGVVWWGGNCGLLLPIDYVRESKWRGTS